MLISTHIPADVAANASPRPDIAVVMDVLRATSTAAVLSARVPQGLLLVPRPEMLEHLPGSPSDYLVFSELTSKGFERTDNSPSVAEVVELGGRTPVLVTTNGTIATSIAYNNAQTVLLASFLNISAVAEAIRESKPERVMLVPTGKIKDASRCVEDDQCAVALAALLRDESIDLVTTADDCRHAPLIVQRLIDEDGLLVDIDYCLRPDVVGTVLSVTKETENVFRIRSGLHSDCV